jgi:hypothetical protein
MCVYVCIYIYIHIHTHARTHIHTYIHTYITSVCALKVRVCEALRYKRTLMAASRREPFSMSTLTAELMPYALYLMSYALYLVDGLKTRSLLDEQPHCVGFTRMSRSAAVKQRRPLVLQARY